jgi:glutamate formiminotransferase/formiminotetrahydrofolate cyclodeaminase
MQSDEMPDYGGGEYTLQAACSGASVVGARKFLIAVNFNLNKETDVQCAKEIALDVHEKGRIVKRDGVPVLDENGNVVRRPGTLKACKAIGWYIEEYGRAQVSMNVTDIDVAPLHKVFEEVSRVALLRGARVTGTEIIGLVPECVLVEAGRYFAAQRGCTFVDDGEAVSIAVETMGLSEIAPFIPDERIIEKLLFS